METDHDVGYAAVLDQVRKPNFFYVKFPIIFESSLTIDDHNLTND